MEAKKYKRPKSELGRELGKLKRKLTNNTLDAWYDWALTTKPDMKRADFDVLSRGSYISKKDQEFAADMLIEGARLLKKQQEGIASAIEKSKTIISSPKTTTNMDNEKVEPKEEPVEVPGTEETSTEAGEPEEESSEGSDASDGE